MTTLFDKLNEFGLDNTTNLEQRLARISDREWNIIADSMDEWYQQHQENTPRHKHIPEPLTFIFPSVQAEYLPKISSHLLFSDKVFLDDPFYDVLQLRASINDFGLTSEGKELTRAKLQDDLSNIIQFYLRAKETIQSNKLIPFKDVMTTVSTELPSRYLFLLVQDNHIWGDILGQKSLPLPVKIVRDIVIRRGSNSLLTKTQKDPLINLVKFLYPKAGYPDRYNLFTTNTYSLQSFITSLFFINTVGGFQGLSTDFLTEENIYLFRITLQLLEKDNQKLAQSEQMKLPIAISKSTFAVPGLYGIPIERVLDEAERNTDAFNTFRASLNEKMIGIDAPVGSQDRERQLARIELEIEHETSSLTASYKAIQKNLNKKFQIYSTLGAFSILTAGLSTLSQNLDALAVASSIIGATTLSASIKEFAGEWIEYHKEIQTLRSNSNFFIWKIKTGVDI